MSIEEMIDALLERSRVVYGNATLNVGQVDAFKEIAAKLRSQEAEMESLNDDLGTCHRKYEALRKMAARDYARLQAAEELVNRIECRPYETELRIKELAKNYRKAGKGESK